MPLTTADLIKELKKKQAQISDNQQLSTVNNFLSGLNQSLKLANDLIRNPIVFNSLPPHLKERLSQQPQQPQQKINLINPIDDVKKNVKKNVKKKTKNEETIALSSNQLYEVIIEFLNFGVQKIPNMKVSDLQALAISNRELLITQLNNYVRQYNAGNTVKAKAEIQDKPKK